MPTQFRFARHGSLLIMPTLGFLLPYLGHAQSAIEEIHLRASVQDVVMLTDFSGKITPVDFDPRFALTVRVESVTPTVKDFDPGAAVAFAIHSPALLFGGKVHKGKIYDFSFRRQIEDGKTRYSGLMVVKKPG